ncbi:MAG: GGDEF domain-containing protein [Emergencia sp.]
MMNAGKADRFHRFQNWSRDMLFYGGLSKTEYENNVQDIAQKNQETLLIGSMLVTALFLALFCGSLVSGNMADARYFYGAMLLASTVIFVMSKTVTPKKPNLVLPMWYMLFIAFSAYGVMLNTFLRPSLSATTICVFLVAGPLLIIDRPIRVFTYTFALSLVFIICAVNAKSSYLAFADSVNVLCCVFLGAVIYTMLNKVKLREMSHARQLQKERDTDRLTMLLNKTAFVEKVQYRLHHAEDGVLLVMDIDDFKGINDSYGHDYGDVILQRTARCIQETFQITDLCARFGGDEYVVFLPEITREELTGLMDQLMERIKQDVVLPDSGNTMGISIGAAFFNSDDHEYRDLFHCADNALYAAKKMGKNRYHIYEE